MNFKRKTVLITGASRGIGRECALEFARQGASNIIIGYNKSEAQALELEAILKEQGVNALALQADIRSKTEVNLMFRRAQAAFGPVHILVNNAGISGFSLFTDITEEMWDEKINMPKTAHTTNLVDFVYLNKEDKTATLEPAGNLGDIAVTVLDVLGVEKPADMTAKSLIKK